MEATFACCLGRIGVDNEAQGCALQPDRCRNSGPEAKSMFVGSAFSGRFISDIYTARCLGFPISLAITANPYKPAIDYKYPRVVHCHFHFNLFSVYYQCSPFLGNPKPYHVRCKLDVLHWGHQSPASDSAPSDPPLLPWPSGVSVGLCLDSRKTYGGLLGREGTIGAILNIGIMDRKWKLLFKNRVCI